YWLTEESPRMLQSIQTGSTVTIPSHPSNIYIFVGTVLRPTNRNILYPENTRLYLQLSHFINGSNLVRQPEDGLQVVRCVIWLCFGFTPPHTLHNGPKCENGNTRCSFLKLELATCTTHLLVVPSSTQLNTSLKVFQ
uniref:Uncharacterized protein n=1 Tax=Mola mola TaxID=94237 RepID=A0A3Q3VLR1_MOLML